MGDMTVDADGELHTASSTLRFGNSFTDQMRGLAEHRQPSLLSHRRHRHLGPMNTPMADLVITRANIGSIGVGTAMGDMMISRSPRPN